MSKSTKVFMVLALLVPVLSSCKMRRINDSKARADITEAGKSVRVIYLNDELGLVYLVTCAKENGKDQDHLLDEQAISRSVCFANANDVGADNARKYTTMRYQDEYLPALTKAIGFTDDGVTTGAEVDALKRNIERQQALLDKLARLVISTDGVNKESVDTQVISVSEKLEALKASLDVNGETRITLLEKLKSYLLITSEDRLNVAEESAGLLLAPFDERERVAQQKADDAERSRGEQEQAKLEAQQQVEDAKRERLQGQANDRQAIKNALSNIPSYETTGRTLRAQEAQERAKFRANVAAGKGKPNSIADQYYAYAEQNKVVIEDLVRQINANLNSYNADFTRYNQLVQAYLQKYGQNP